MTGDPEKDVSLERLAEAKGILTAARGPKGTRLGRCPFAEHTDENAFVVDAKANTWRCLAGCGEGGVVAFVARIEGVSETHALGLLKADYSPTGTGGVKKSTRLRGESLLAPEEPDDVVLDRVLAYYARVLLDSPEALRFLADHGVKDPEAIVHFRLGYCDRTLGYKLPKANRKAGAAVRGQLLRLGVLRESGHEHFRGSIVVPLTDATGKVVNVYGHKLRDDLRTGTATEVWLNETDGVLNPTGLVENGKVILTGSVLDTLTWWSAGHRNVTTTCGKGSIPTAVRDLLVARKIRSVAVALRRDDDGEKAFEAISEELRALGVEIVRVVFPAGSDAVEVARKGGSLSELLKVANWVSAGTPPKRAPAAPGATTEPEPTAGTGEVVLAFGDRRWRVRGLDENTSHGSIRVNLMVSRGDTAAFHVDTIELYSARQRGAFLSAAASETGCEERVLKKDLGSVLLQLERLVDERVRAALDASAKPTITLSDADREQALAFLRDPNLLDRIVSDFDALGIVGEVVNKQVAYLAAVSRLLPHPLAVVLQASPASGKSALLDAVLRLVPEEERLAFSAVTGRSLYYLDRNALAHKVLAIAEEEGAGTAAYALKLLHSEGSLSIASTAKDTKSGRLATHTYAVAGPVALLMTTTSLEVDEELLSRCIVLSVDEGREHTRAIHREQRRRLTVGGLGSRHDSLVKLHNDAQRLLRRLRVVIPEGLAIEHRDHRVGHRRDFAKVLGLVQAVALLRQHQRRVHETDDGIKYIEATDDDVRVALGLLAKPDEELPPGTRTLLGLLDTYVADRADREGLDRVDVRFTRRELREALAVGDTQLRVHLARLVALEYVLRHARDGRVVYELLAACRGPAGGLPAPCRGDGGSGGGPDGSDASSR